MVPGPFVCVYLLLEDYFPICNRITLDDKLPGWGDQIKQQLLDLIWRKDQLFDQPQVQIALIGEKIRADRIAWLVRTKKQKPDKKLSKKDLLSLVI